MIRVPHPLEFAAGVHIRTRYRLGMGYLNISAYNATITPESRMHSHACDLHVRKHDSHELLHAGLNMMVMT